MPLGAVQPGAAAVASGSGSLFEDFEPAINPPEEVDDPDDSKPSSWVDMPKCACLPARELFVMHIHEQHDCRVVYKLSSVGMHA